MHQIVNGNCQVDIKPGQFVRFDGPHCAPENCEILESEDYFEMMMNGEMPIEEEMKKE